LRLSRRRAEPREQPRLLGRPVPNLQSCRLGFLTLGRERLDVEQEDATRRDLVEALAGPVQAPVLELGAFEQPVGQRQRSPEPAVLPVIESGGGEPSYCFLRIGRSVFSWVTN
jgi:hypothetical protein